MLPSRWGVLVHERRACRRLAYRRIGVSAYRRIGVSAYRRIGVASSTERVFVKSTINDPERLTFIPTLTSL
jgi:hypothetical protein